MGMVDFSLGEIGNVFKDIRVAITGKEILDPGAKLKLLEELNKAEARMMEAQSKTIVAESSSPHWITSAWRPITMLTFVAIIANNYILVPYFNLMGIPIKILDIPPDMWTLLQLGLSGYIVGRSGEKMTKIWKAKQ